MRTNQAIHKAVPWAMSGAVFVTMSRAAYAVTYWPVSWAVSDAVSRAMIVAVHVTVDGAARKDPPHPTLHDFLSGAIEETP